MAPTPATGRAATGGAEPAGDGITAPQLMVLVAIAVAVAGQGGYYLGPRVAVAVILAAAAALFCFAGPRRRYLRQPVPLALAALAGWAIIGAGVAGSPGGALPTVATLGEAGAVALIVGHASFRQRDRLARSIIAVGTVAALSGWLGVVFRLSRWASPGSGLWRATTTITYSNAAAAFMAALVLLVWARLVSRSGAVERAAAVLLLVGVAATLSRAGIVGVALGWLALGALLGPKRVAVATGRPLAGAIIAVASLAPSLGAHSPARQALAVAGLVVGLIAGAAPMPVGRRRRQALRVPAAVAVAVSAAILTLGVVAFAVAWGPARSAAWHERVTLSSPSRSDERRAALTLVEHHPVTGVGPGQATLLWATANHALQTDRYAHDEYLQLAAEDGLVGLLLLAVIAAAVVATARAGRPHRDHPARAQWAGAAVALGYLGLHSGLDFLWHVPAVILVAAALVGLTTAPHTTNRTTPQLTVHREDAA